MFTNLRTLAALCTTIGTDGRTVFTQTAGFTKTDGRTIAATLTTSGANSSAMLAKTAAEADFSTFAAIVAVYTNVVGTVLTNTAICASINRDCTFTAAFMT